MAGYKSLIQGLLAKADIQINGDRPHDMQVHDERLFQRIVKKGTLGLGEAYMDGWWSAERLEQFFYQALKSRIDSGISKTWLRFFRNLQASLMNMQSRIRSKRVIREHYNLGNDLYMSFLDPYNQYTCGYFKDTNDLNVAQEQKLDLICKKLDLKEDDKVLDIGCGWGGFLKFAAEKVGCHVTGITISDEQLKYAKEFTQGLPVEVKKMDYRDLKGKFDKVLICGMIEHVGYKNYRRIFETVHQHLTDTGRFLLHTIGGNTSMRSTDPWISKYIFSNSLIPSVKQLSTAAENLFVMEDWQNFGYYYFPTLMAWYENFKNNWDTIKERYDDRFFRMWEYYLLSCAGSFKARDNQLWQVVFSKAGIPGGFSMEGYRQEQPSFLYEHESAPVVGV